jgi:hypothetical protein
MMRTICWYFSFLFLASLIFSMDLVFCFTFCFVFEKWLVEFQLKEGLFWVSGSGCFMVILDLFNSLGYWN